MSHSALTKLVEECGELVQVAAKLIAYPDGVHPDGGGDLLRRLEEEIADVVAASAFVAGRLDLNDNRIADRRNTKLALYHEWHNEPYDETKGCTLT